MVPRFDVGISRCLERTGFFHEYFIACYAVNTLDGQVNGLSPQAKRWVSSEAEHMLLASPGPKLLPVAGFAAAVTYFGPNPVGTWILLPAHM